MKVLFCTFRTTTQSVGHTLSQFGHILTFWLRAFDLLGWFSEILQNFVFLGICLIFRCFPYIFVIFTKSIEDYMSYFIQCLSFLGGILPILFKRVLLYCGFLDYSTNPACCISESHSKLSECGSLGPVSTNKLLYCCMFYLNRLKYAVPNP